MFRDPHRLEGPVFDDVGLCLRHARQQQKYTKNPTFSCAATRSKVLRRQTPRHLMIVGLNRISKFLSRFRFRLRVMCVNREKRKLFNFQPRDLNTCLRMVNFLRVQKRVPSLLLLHARSFSSREKNFVRVQSTGGSVMRPVESGKVRSHYLD